MASLLQDIRYAVRGLANNPGFTALTVLTLALGIGVTTAAFGVVDAVLYRPQPALTDPDRLVALYGDHLDTREHDYRGINYPDYPAYQSQTAFSDLAVYLRFPVIADTPVDNVLTAAEIVTGNYFEVVGADVIRGRPLLADDDVPGAPMAAVISDRFWNTHFNRDPTAIGRTLALNSSLFTIVGVVEEGFRGVLLDWIDVPDVWVTTSSVPKLMGGDGLLRLRIPAFPAFMSVARLRSGVSLEQAGRSTDRIAAQLAEQYPDTNADWKIDLLPVGYARFWPGHREAIVPFLKSTLAVAGIVLIVACLNAAGLLLARGTERRGDVAIRQALGASRIRLIRQLIVEALVLVGCAAGIGIWITGGVRTLLTLFPRPFMIPFDLDVPVDARVLLFAAFVSLGSVLLFALAPAWRATRFAPFDPRCWRGQGQRRSFDLRQIALVGQVALCLLLVITAGLLSRSLNRMTDIDPGFDLNNLLLLTIDPRGMREGGAGWSWDEAVEEILSLPGVSSVGLSNGTPFGRGVSNREVVAPGVTVPISVNARSVSRGYFGTLGIPLRGNDFRGVESDGGTVIINQVMADRIWPSEDALGRQLSFVGEGGYRHVVAVSGDLNCGSLLDDPSPCLYEPWAGNLFSTAVLRIRSEAVPTDVVPPLRERLTRLSADVALYDVRTMDAHLAERLSGPRLTAFLSSSLSVITLLLVAVGVFALISATVSQSTREIGIRMAVGAEPRQVLVPLLGKILVLIAVGMAVGIAFSLATTGYLASQLFGVSATDPLTFLLSAGALIVVAAVASYIPAIRATRIDPMVALRHE